MQIPFITDEQKSTIPQSLAGCDIISVPVIHRAARYGTFISCDPLHRDHVMALYAAQGWTVEDVTAADVYAMKDEHALMLLLEAWGVAGESAIGNRIGSLYHELSRGRG